MKNNQNKTKNPEGIFSVMIQEIRINEKEEQVTMKTAETSYWKPTYWFKKKTYCFCKLDFYWTLGFIVNNLDNWKNNNLIWKFWSK